MRLRPSRNRGPRARFRRASSRPRRTPAIARGAPPADAGRVASVPIPTGAAQEALAQRDRELSRRGDRKKVGVLDADAAWTPGPEARRVDLERPAAPGGAVDDAAGRPARTGGADVPAAEREPAVRSAVASRRAASPETDARRRRPRSGPRRPTSATHGGDAVSGDGAATPAAAVPRCRRAPRDRRRGRARTGSAARDSSRGSAGRCARDRARCSGS